jgi:uncharacterized membrane protein YagU involved in acid resistance
MLHAHAMARVAPDWRAALGAGVIAGAVFLVLEMMMVPLFLGGGPWDPPRMIAAIVLGESVLPMPGQAMPSVDARIVVAALFVHFALSVLYALILSAVIARTSSRAALAVGAAFGLALYIINFYGFTALFPWFAMARNWVSIVAHAVFGLAAAWMYEVIARRDETRATGVS